MGCYSGKSKYGQQNNRGEGEPIKGFIIIDEKRQYQLNQEDILPQQAIIKQPTEETVRVPGFGQVTHSQPQEIDLLSDDENQEFIITLKTLELCMQDLVKFTYELEQDLSNKQIK